MLILDEGTRLRISPSKTPCTKFYVLQILSSLVDLSMFSICSFLLFNQAQELGTEYVTDASYTPSSGEARGFWIPAMPH